MWFDVLYATSIKCQTTQQRRTFCTRLYPIGLLKKMKVDLVLFSRIDAYSTVTNFSCDTRKFLLF